MYLTQTAEYGLRVMAYMATQELGIPLRTRDLSKVVDIPAYYLSKIMRKLVESGLLESKKGHGGGFTIALPLDRIRLTDILSAMDYEIASPKCVFCSGQCSELAPCPLHFFWIDIKANFISWSEKYSLEDVRNNKLTISGRHPNPDPSTQD